jgi:hypothetical protein
MQICLLPIAALFLFLGCLQEKKPRKASFSEIKVMVVTSGADDVTAYNKGLLITDYVYYNVATDSLIYRELTDIEPYRFKTYTGVLDNQQYIDSFQALVNVLKQLPNGEQPDRFADDGAMDSRIPFYVEFKDSDGEHFYYFLNDSLRAFEEFFFRLPDRPWKKEAVDNNLINVDEEAVTAIKKVGMYEKIEPPYIAQPCVPGNARALVYGSWREVYTSGRNRMQDYIKLTLTKGGKWIRVGLSKGKVYHRWEEGKFTLSTDRKMILVDFGNGVEKYHVLKLSETCMELKGEGQFAKIKRYDRL